LACSGLHTTPTVSSHPLDLGLSSAPGSFAPRDGSPENIKCLSGKQLSIHSQGAITALTVKPLPSRLLGISISLCSNHSVELTGLARVCQLPLSEFPRRGFLWTEQYPQVYCHLEQFRFETDKFRRPSHRRAAIDSSTHQASDSISRTDLSLHSSWLTIDPFYFAQLEHCGVLRSARYPCQSHQDPAWLPKDLTAPPSLSPARSGSKHYAFKLLDR
jgi:hypothetical protein